MSGRFVYDPMGGGSTWVDDMDANFQADPQAMAQAQQWAQQVFKTGQNPFQTRGDAKFGYQVLDPSTGQWGPGFVYADPTNVGARVIMPQSVASKIMPPSQLDSSNFNYSPSSANIGDSQFDTGLIPIAALGGLAGAAGLGAFDAGGALAGSSGGLGAGLGTNGGTLASLAASAPAAAAGATEAITPYELGVAGSTAAGPTGFGALTGGATAGGASIADLGTGTFGSPGADATAAQATSGGTIGSGGYDAATAAGAGATGIGSTAASGASALSKILAGNGTAADYASLLGQAAPGLLGAYGASQQASALSDLADKYYNAGAPSRARYEASMTPGFDPTTIPGYSGALDSASGAILSKLSTQGNPYGNPGALIEANKQIVNGTALPAVQNYQSLNANAGGISSMNAAAPGVAQQAIGSSGGVLSALGSAAGSVLNPPQSLSDLLKSLGYGGGGTSLA